MKLCYLLDVDNTIVPNGSDELFPWVAEKVNALIREGKKDIVGCIVRLWPKG